MKYKTPITYNYHSKDMANVKVFKMKVKLQGEGQVKNHKRCLNQKEHTYEL
jgi:hypothetical protein